MQEIGRRGGQSRSEIKVNASRKNGKLGGRPKKKVEGKYHDDETKV